MKTIHDISCFTISDTTLVYASGKSVYWLERSVAFEEVTHTFIQTKDFVIAVTGGTNVSYVIKKEHLAGPSSSWTKLPRFALTFGYQYERNLIILHSGIFRDERSWVFCLDDSTEKEYPFTVQFVPESDYVFTFENPMPFFEGLSGDKVGELQFAVKKNQPYFAFHVLGLCNNIVWILTAENDISGYNLTAGSPVKSIDPFKLIASKDAEANSIGFGGDKNYYNFHIDLLGQRIVTFANRYYCEINLMDFSSKVIDLNLVSKRIRIVKSTWCPERKWLFFVGNEPNDVFDQHFGIFDTVSEKIIDIDKAKDKKEFFGRPPVYGNDTYGALSTKKVLYVKPVK